MKDEEKTKEQLVRELVSVRDQMAELSQSEAERGRRLLQVSLRNYALERGLIKE
jgi:hypothetical protein